MAACRRRLLLAVHGAQAPARRSPKVPCQHERPARAVELQQDGAWLPGYLGGCGDGNVGVVADGGGDLQHDHGPPPQARCGLPPWRSFMSETSSRLVTAQVGQGFLSLASAEAALRSSLKPPAGCRAAAAGLPRPAPLERRHRQTRRGRPGRHGRQQQHFMPRWVPERARVGSGDGVGAAGVVGAAGDHGERRRPAAPWLS